MQIRFLLFLVRKDSPHLALLIGAMFLFIVTEFKLLSVVYLFVKSWRGGGKRYKAKRSIKLMLIFQRYKLVTLYYFMHVFDCVIALASQMTATNDGKIFFFLTSKNKNTCQTQITRMPPLYKNNPVTVAS